MCFSLAGRIQTRLAALTVPAAIAAVLLLLTGDTRYFTMFQVVALVALDLELVAYRWAFAYQARWQTYLIGVLEFPLYLVIVYGLGGTLPLPTIVGYYAAGWVGGLLVVNVALPILDQTWTEHGGELLRPLQGRLPAGLPYVIALGLVTFLQLTVIAGALTPGDVAASLAGAALMGWVARRVGRSGPTWTDCLQLGLLVPLLIRAPNPMPFALGAALAVAFTSWGRLSGRSVLNGAAAVLVALVLCVPGVYAADGQWGNSLLLPLVLANIAVLLAWLSGRLVLVAAFYVPFLAHAALVAHGHGDPFQTVLPLLVPTYLVFFAGFVVPEAATAPGRRLGQFAVGLAAGGIGVGLQLHGLGLPYALALLLTNYGISLVRAGIGVVRARAQEEAAPVRTPKTNSSAALTPATVLHTAAAPHVTRRTFLSATGAVGGSLVLGGALGRLTSLDPAALALPADAALSGGSAIPHFQNVAAQAGLVLSHHGSPGEGSPAIGTGAAWGDFDNDGWLDLYVTDHMGPSHLYRNNRDGTFTDLAAGAGVAHPGQRTTSATWVDYDNDGWLDLYVGVAYGPNVLYHNNRDGTFTDVTTHAGLGDTGRTMSTAWADYDGDGYLDVFVANYAEEAITFDSNSNPGQNTQKVMRMPRPQSRLYHNNGDGTFSDVTPHLGFNPSRGLGFSAVWFDYNGDGRPDLYVAYDFGSVLQPNTLWRNDGPGGATGWRFTEVQSPAGVNSMANCMGAASGDYNNDGWLDLAVSNIGPNFLYQNGGNGRFREVAARSHLTYHNQVIDNAMDPSMTWGLDFADLNNDGWLDLYIVAGAMDFEHVPQPNLLFLNNHRGGFIDVSTASGTNDPGQGRSVAVGDYDRDGHLDMFVANYGQPPLLYRNLGSSTRNRWIRLKLEGTQSNRDAVGAHVTLYAPGMNPQTREVQIGQGLGSCDDTSLHFGLGQADHVDRIEIRWPSGVRRTLHNLAANREIKVREPGPSRWPPRGRPR